MKSFAVHVGCGRVSMMLSYDAPIVWHAQLCTMFNTATDPSESFVYFNLQSFPI